MTEESLRGRRILVTGATGFLGAALVRTLVDREADVTILVRDANPRRPLFESDVYSRVAVVSGALEDDRAIERALVQHEIDTVFHLGAQTLVGPAYREPLGTFESNIRGTYLLLDACRRQARSVRRIVVASSDKAYGSVDVLPYTEDTPLAGRHPYDVSKSCTDLIAQTYATTYGLPVTIARCGNIFGHGDVNYSRLVPGTIRSLLVGERPVIRSDGTYRRDYIFLDDAVAAYMMLAEHAADDTVRGRGFNFGPGRSHSVIEVVDAIRDEFGPDALAADIRDEAVAEIHDQHLAVDRARTTFGFHCRTGFVEALRRTIPWYRERLGATRGR